MEKKINPLDFEKNVAIGVALPLVDNEQGMFNLHYTSLKQAKTNLLNLLLTNKGERVMLPDYGIGLKLLLFENNNYILDDIKDIITSGVSKWVPYVVIKNINLSIDDRNEHKILLSIEFSLEYNIEDTEELTIDIITN